MKKIFSLLFAIALTASALHAQTPGFRISTLPEADAVSEDDYTVVAQGSITRRAPLSLVRQVSASQVSDATTVGRNLMRLTNPGAVRFLRFNADNSVSVLNASDTRTALGLGTAALENSTAFATAVQGGKADTAVQPGDLATVATSGLWSDIGSKPTTLAGYGITDAAAATDARFPTSSEKAAMTAAASPSGANPFITDSDPRLSDDRTPLNHTHALSDITNAGSAAAQDVEYFATAAQGATADTAVQPGDLAAVATSGAFGDLTGKPTTLAGYGITDAGTSAPVQSVAGKTGAVTLSKSDVGLGNVDNTSDANKPISTATQTALDAKANLPGSNGLIARTGAGTTGARTLTGTTGQITVTNGDGVSGNPTVSLPGTITLDLQFNGSITIGDSALDVLTINAGINAPNATSTGTNDIANVGALDGRFRRAGTILGPNNLQSICTATLTTQSGSSAGQSPWQLSIVEVSDNVIKFMVPVPYDITGQVKVITYWTDRSVSTTAGNIAVWTTPITVAPTTNSATDNRAQGTQIQNTFTAAYSGSARFYVVEQTINFGTVTGINGTSLLQKYIEVQRRGTDASDTSVSSIFLSAIYWEEL